MVVAVITPPTNAEKMHDAMRGMALAKPIDSVCYYSAADRSRIQSVRQDPHNHHGGATLNCVYEFANSPIHMQLPIRDMINGIKNKTGLSNLNDVNLGPFFLTVQKFVNSLHRIYPKDHCSRSIGPTVGNSRRKSMLCSKCIVYFFMRNIKETTDGCINVPDQSSICVALLEYGKLFTVSPITRIDNMSDESLKRNIIYAPSNLASKFIASAVSLDGKIGLSITKEKGIQFTLQSILDQIDAAGYVLLHHILQITKLCSLVIKSVSMLNGALYLPLPRIISLDPSEGSLVFTAMFPSQMREKCVSITGKPIEYIGRLRYTLEGVVI